MSRDKAREGYCGSSSREGETNIAARLEGKIEYDMLLKLHTPGVVWRKLADVFRPEQMAIMALLETLDGVKIGARDDLEQKLLEMEDIVQGLSSSGNHQPRSEDYTLLKFVDALLHEYNIQKQLLEDRDRQLSQDVMTSVRKRFEWVIF